MTVYVLHMVEWCERHGQRIDKTGRSAYGFLLALHGGELFDLDTPAWQMPAGSVVH
jgi:hypothetical protein